MQTLIWAFGTMVVLFLFFSILPLGYSVKGRFLIASASFIISLAGLLGASTFPLWQIGILLLALAFFSAYFIDKRLGHTVYHNGSQDAVVFNQGNDIMNLSSKSEILKGDSLILGKAPELPSDNLIPVASFAVNEHEIPSDDSSLLLEREINVEEQLVTEIESEIAYLAGIDNLLEVESEEKVDGELLEIENFSTSTSGQDEPEYKREHLDDSLFEYLLAAEEAAGKKENDRLGNESKKQISMQK